MTRSELHTKIEYICNILLTIIGLVSAGIFFRQLGFYPTTEEQAVLALLLQVVVALFIIQEGARWFFVAHWREHLHERAFEHVVAVLLVSSVLGQSHLLAWLHRLLPTATFAEVAIGYLGFTQLWILLAHVLRWIRESEFLTNLKIGPNRLFILSFVFAILVLTALLKLPKATVSGISWLDALFTAVSAICVTGLSTVDLGTSFTRLGQFFVLCGIQAGGLGIMTLTMTLGTFFKGGLGVKERLLFGDMINAERIGEVGRLLVRIALFTLFVEAVGASILYLSLASKESMLSPEVTWEVVFHSISAFCNAGFSIYRENLAAPQVVNNYLHQGVIMGLIVLGGIGFPVLSNLWDVIRTRRRTGDAGRVLVHTTTKLVLVTTVGLLLGGTVLIWLLERTASWQAMSAGDQWFQALFLSVSSRTAGFNLSAMDVLSAGTVFVVIVLMWIGASPMSTGGGIKTLTFALALLTIRAVVIGKDRVEVFGREISRFSIIRCFVVIMASLITVATLCVVMISLEPKLAAGHLIFEVFSALGTVGLSQGITANLSSASKSLIIFTMFIGRMGFLTFLTGLYFGKGTVNYKYLREQIQIS